MLHNTLNYISWDQNHTENEERDIRMIMMIKYRNILIYGFLALNLLKYSMAQSVCASEEEETHK
jgi:hypothetical protein